MVESKGTYVIISQQVRVQKEGAYINLGRNVYLVYREDGTPVAEWRGNYRRLSEKWFWLE